MELFFNNLHKTNPTPQSGLLNMLGKQFQCNKDLRPLPIYAAKQQT